MKEKDWYCLIKQLAQEDEKEQRNKLHQVKMLVNGSVLGDLMVLGRRFGANNLGKTLESCIGLAKLVSDKLEEGAVIVLLERDY